MQYLLQMGSVCMMYIPRFRRSEVERGRFIDTGWRSAKPTSGKKTNTCVGKGIAFHLVKQHCMRPLLHGLLTMALL
jgi:hypothetical protein